MAMVRWSPVRSMFPVQGEIGRLIDEVLSGRVDPEFKGVLQPAVDIEESPEGYFVRAELPGMKLEDIKITLADNELIVRGEKRREMEKKDATYH
ncbi:MAG: Hsp20/alpha crystallin family protein, partial [Candidatus Eiseniibacteriota bacterium]